MHGAAGPVPSMPPSVTPGLDVITGSAMQVCKFPYRHAPPRHLACQLLYPSVASVASVAAAGLQAAVSSPIRSTRVSTAPALTISYYFGPECCLVLHHHFHSLHPGDEGCIELLRTVRSKYSGISSSFALFPCTSPPLHPCTSPPSHLPSTQCS
jgi:hypothetical protein|eukprot:6892513-Prymnesium_polylepis.1